MSEKEAAAISHVLGAVAGVPQRDGPAKAVSDTGVAYTSLGASFVGEDLGDSHMECARATVSMIKHLIETVSNHGVKPVEIVWRRKPIWVVTLDRASLSCRLAVEKPLAVAA